MEGYGVLAERRRASPLAHRSRARRARRAAPGDALNLATSGAERDNATVWRPGRHGFYEVYYLKLNQPAEGFALWLRYTILAPQDAARAPVPELWAIAFDARSGRHVACKETRDQSDLVVAPGLSLRIGDALLEHGRARGEVAGAEGRIAWDLAWEPSQVGLRHFRHAALYRLPVPKTKVLSPNVDVRMRGTVDVNGRTVRLEDAPGMQAHLYGTRHAESWAWGHVNAWDDASRRDWFEGVSAVIALAGRRLSPLTVLCFSWRGRLYAFNRLGELRRNRSAAEEPSWSFSCEDGTIRLEGRLEAAPGSFVGVRYTDTDGSARFCRNSKIARAELRVLVRPDASLPFRQEDELVAQDAAALEFVSREENPAVATRI